MYTVYCIYMYMYWCTYFSEFFPCLIPSQVPQFCWVSERESPGLPFFMVVPAQHHWGYRKKLYLYPTTFCNKIRHGNSLGLQFSANGYPKTVCLFTFCHVLFAGKRPFETCCQRDTRPAQEAVVSRSKHRSMVWVSDCTGKMFGNPRLCIFWLVVWNMTFIVPCIGNSHPN